MSYEGFPGGPVQLVDYQLFKKKGYFLDIL
jgi:hypothetical protein